MLLLLKEIKNAFWEILSQLESKDLSTMFVKTALNAVMFHGKVCWNLNILVFFSRKNNDYYKYMWLQLIYPVVIGGDAVQLFSEATSCDFKGWLTLLYSLFKLPKWLFSHYSTGFLIFLSMNKNGCFSDKLYKF